MMKILISLALIVTSTHSFAGSHDVFGKFLTQEKNSHIQIVDCGNGAPCGKVVWINPATLQDGVTPETAKAKSGKRVLGMQILSDFKRKKNDWRGGTIYDPGKDKSYKSRLKRLENGSLEVKGCISFICQTQIWNEVSSE